jgi:hypothetical protein
MRQVPKIQNIFFFFGVHVANGDDPINITVLLNVMKSFCYLIIDELK